MKVVANDEPCDFYYLNLFGLQSEVDDKSVFDFYKGVKISHIYRTQRGALDLEFETREMFIRAIDVGSGTIKGQPFCIRSSYYNNRRSKRDNYKESGGFRGNKSGGYERERQDYVKEKRGYNKDRRKK